MLSLLQANCLVFESQVVVIAEIDRSVGRVDRERSFSLTSSTTGSERYINHWLETTTSTSNIPIKNALPLVDVPPRARPACGIGFRLLWRPLPLVAPVLVCSDSPRMEAGRADS